MGPDAATSKPRSPSSGLALANADAPKAQRTGSASRPLLFWWRNLAPRFAFRARLAPQARSKRRLSGSGIGELAGFISVARHSEIERSLWTSPAKPEGKRGTYESQSGGGERCHVYCLQVLTVMLAAITMALSLAHALEFPGKLRLSQEQYLAVQPIYYPGFTIGGIAEPAGILAALALLIVTPIGTAAFWLVAAALAALIAVQVIFWTRTQPANSFWLQRTELSRCATHFFQTGQGRAPRDWTAARDQWERSHLYRALVATPGLFLLTVAVALGG